MKTMVGGGQWVVGNFFGIWDLRVVSVSYGCKRIQYITIKKEFNPQVHLFIHMTIITIKNSI